MNAEYNTVPGDDSKKPLAMREDIVWPGLKREVGIAADPEAFPMSIVTAIVSPTALPRPKMTAPKIPERP